VIGVISKTNRREELKQATTHKFRCLFRPYGGSKSRILVRTTSLPQPQNMQQIAALRQVSTENAEGCEIGSGLGQPSRIVFQDKARHSSAIRSISTRTFLGRRATSTVDRAGGCVTK